MNSKENSIEVKTKALKEAHLRTEQKKYSKNKTNPKSGIEPRIFVLETKILYLDRRLSGLGYDYCF